MNKGIFRLLGIKAIHGIPRFWGHFENPIDLAIFPENHGLDRNIKTINFDAHIGKRSRETSRPTDSDNGTSERGMRSLFKSKATDDALGQRRNRVLREGRKPLGDLVFGCTR
jgi:hypothetical protein